MLLFLALTHGGIGLVADSCCDPTRVRLRPLGVTVQYKVAITSVSDGRRRVVD